jgi:uncharacterized membrane protein YiaA
MSAFRIFGILGMVAGFTVFVVGVFVADRYTGLIVSTLGIGIMLAGVAATSHAQKHSVGPGD